jgi:tetratricopeptide (TPR) repeat protein
MLIAGLLVRAGFLHSPAHALDHPGGIHTRAEFDAARKAIAAGTQPYAKAWERLTREANRSLDKSAEAVVDFNVPGYYQDAQGHRKAMGRLSRDAWAAYACAVAYQLDRSGDRNRYADKAVQMITAWAAKNKKTSNFDGNLAMATAGTGLVFAAEVIHTYEGWSEERRAVFRKWLKTVFLKACTRIAGGSNNWGDWGTLGCIASHHFLDDENGIDKDIARIRGKIDRAIKADGMMPHETRRGKNGIWYTYFALAPMTAACRIAMNARGTDLFAYKGADGAGIREALDYLFKYCLAPESWPHFKGTPNPPRPNRWPGNLFESMIRIYPEKKWEKWIEDSRPLLIHGHHYAWAMPTLLPPAGYLELRKVTDVFDRGKAAQKAGRIGEAIRLYTEGLAEAKRNAVDNSRCSAVRAQIAKLVEQGKKTLAEAARLMKEAKLGQAASLLEKTAARYEGHRIAGEAEAAITRIGRIERDQKKAADVLARARAEIGQREYVRAVERLRSIIARYPATRSAREARAEIEGLKKKPEAAKVIDEAGRRAKCRQHLNMAKNYMRAGMRAEAVKYLDRVISLCPDGVLAEEARRLKKNSR